MDNIDICVMVS